MRNIFFYSVVVTLASAVLTWNAVAVPVSKVHMLDNLTPEESSLAAKIIDKKGYKLSHRPIFTESHKVVMITKALGNETEPPSIQLEVVHQKDEKDIPKRVFIKKLETKNLIEVLEKLPTPDKLEQTINSADESVPFAYQGY